MLSIEAAKDLLLGAGASWVLGLLVLLSIAMSVVVIERVLCYRAAAADLDALAKQVGEALVQGRLDEAVKGLQASSAVAARIALAGLELAREGYGPHAVEEAMRSAMMFERTRLERGLAFLSTLGTNAPFVGLLGTVIGVMHAFEELGHGAPGHGTVAAAGEVASQAVMEAIAEALVATAVGLLVALPAVAAHNYLERRMTVLLDGGDALSRLVLAHLHGRPSQPPFEGRLGERSDG